jgi:hypothetical protein
MAIIMSAILLSTFLSSIDLGLNAACQHHQMTSCPVLKEYNATYTARYNQYQYYP